VTTGLEKSWNENFNPLKHYYEIIIPIAVIGSKILSFRNSRIKLEILQFRKVSRYIPFISLSLNSLKLSSVIYCIKILGFRCVFIRHNLIRYRHLTFSLTVSGSVETQDLSTIKVRDIVSEREARRNEIVSQS
jgi:hypothetical protein